MIIKNAKIYQESGSFIDGTILIDDDRITELDYNCCWMEASRHNCHTLGEEESVREIYSDDFQVGNGVIDADGLYAIPGLTDLHFHGCAGFDFCDGTKEALDAITTYEAFHGITSICPATMTLPEETLSEICRSVADYDNIKGSVICGIHMEGPFLSAKKKGAQKEAFLRKPDLELFRRLNDLSGNRFKIVSIAPEEPGAMGFIESLKDEVVLSLAHTAADYDTALQAFGKGASHVTHMFNAMTPFLQREPGVIGAAFDTKACSVELICDGIHLHPSIVRSVFQMFGEDRVTLISDSMMATGLPDGTYSLGGQEVKVKGKSAVLQDGTLAGSVTNLMECMKNAVLNMNIPLETAIKAAAVNPAKVIGCYESYGSITPGKIANIVLLDRELNIRAVIVKGIRIS